MRLRPLEEADLETVRLLRNRNRQSFFHDDEVTPDQQQRWFESLSGRPVRFYVIEEGGTVVGTVSATETPEGVKIGNLIIDEAHRGRGLMRRALEDLTRAPGRYYGLVKPDNAVSLRVFARAGFEPLCVRVERVVR
jgi:RimJ/RimL family protein N-acetyltransferase